MAYGGVDRRVPQEHGTAFKEAVSKANADLQWVWYPTEGHGWKELATNVDFWTRVEKFLDKHIGQSALSN
jgi:dipeptidyl aminopeptidase/acylaminoacyl peptidase